MSKKLNSKKVTAEVKIINKNLKKHTINPQMKNLIETNILLVKIALSDLVTIKKIGSYAIGGLYNFSKNMEIDLLAIKYINRQMYRTYENEIEVKDHFLDCWICEINEVIFYHLEKQFANLQQVEVKWNTTNIKVGLDKVLKFRDSIKIEFLQNNFVIFSFIIRTALNHKKYLPIFCDKKRYQQTTALEFVSTYQKLNQVLIKKLDILFFYLITKYKNFYGRKEILMMKLFILSDIQTKLTQNPYLKYWLSKIFNQVFPNKKAIDELFATKHIYYRNYKPVQKLYRSFLLKNLRWVFNRTYVKVRDFLNYYLNSAADFVNAKKYKVGFVEFWYDSVVYLQSTNGSSTLTKKRDEKKFDDLDIGIIVKNIYPSDNNIGVFLVLMSYYKFKINFFRRGK